MGGPVMAEHMYKVIELIGSSSESWEAAAASIVEEAAKHLKDLRIAEVTQMDMQISEGKVISYRVKVKVSFKYHPKSQV
jgi:flavin-binding protein dodecin